MSETVVTILNPGGKAPLLLVADHASNHIPGAYGTLGLDQRWLETHVAYDIGAEALTRKLSKALDAPAILARFSRLVIDPNRAPGQLGLIVEESDNLKIPGNRFLPRQEIDHRTAHFYEPFHRAISETIDARLEAGVTPALVSIHSFTSQMQTKKPRPWHVGLMWNEDERLARSIMNILAEDHSLVIGENEPYSGRLLFYTMRHHGEDRGLLHTQVEMCQDQLGDDTAIEEWAKRLGEAISISLAL